MRIVRIGIVAILAIATTLAFVATHAEKKLIQTTERIFPRDFRLPMDIPVAISGTFGELRPNHFHTGLDFKTNQREGYPVHAVADGYVSRLRVQIGGFGNAIYINHPNGYTTVYAHLQRYSPRIAHFVKTAQYSRESFEVDFNPLPIEIPVKKGEIIGYSGNSGSSQGAHLHFETRDSKTEEAFNPQLFGFPIADTKAPFIKGLYVYPMNDSSSVNGSNIRTSFALAPIGSGKYSVSKAVKVNVNGDIAFGIAADDMLNGAGNRNGIYSIELKKDGQTVIKTVFESLNFNLQRDVNSYIDFNAYQTGRTYIQKSFIDPGNRLEIYKTNVNRGIITFEDNAPHQMEYIVKDAAGNTSTLTFTVNSTPTKKVYSHYVNPSAIPFYWNKVNRFSNQSIIATFPTGCFYNNFNFEYSSSRKVFGAYSDIHTLHNKYTPIAEPFILQIKPDADLTQFDKAVIVNDKRTYQGGTYENGFVKAELKSFGSFYITIDTTAPRIVPLNIMNGKNMSGTASVSFRISDNLSGIKEFRGLIDDHWVLFEMDGKSGVLKHTFDERTGPGNHTLQLTVTDIKNNSSVYNAEFSR
ncbi:M23 family metallopeptidase [Solitalea koreensis]|uniref:Peptidase family M23 n=1 Tax=Solitalea koreensis TaxID=543615 RepID=A0A521D200_9SPHI|nr:M23 family metallopeptidase [Solitalea koreensis]SMO65031.1 Peptidase family M23 [Solitalea koreensis]